MALRWQNVGQAKVAEQGRLLYIVSAYGDRGMFRCVIIPLDGGAQSEPLKDSLQEALDHAEEYAAWKAGGRRPHYVHESLDRSGR